MKMHSYTEANKQLRIEYLQNQNEKKNTNSSLYPKNLTISNFTLYMWMPVIVYEVEYPRTTHIRVKYTIQKGVNCILAIVGSYLIVSENILPVIYQRENFSIIQSICSILLPVFTVNLLVFWMVFENYLNFFGEITRFGDRLFYLDWWNSNGVEDLNRRWNRPVHMFLYKHVYLTLIQRFKLKTDNAKALTVVFSAVLHEFCLAVALQQITPILMGCMILQVPLIMIIRKYKIRMAETNFFMWYSIIQGIPIIIVLYVRWDDINEQGLKILI